MTTTPPACASTEGARPSQPALTTAAGTQTGEVVLRDLEWPNDARSAGHCEAVVDGFAYGVTIRLDDGAWVGAGPGARTATLPYIDCERIQIMTPWESHMPAAHETAIEAAIMTAWEAEEAGGS